MIIGITGQKRAGKDTAAEAFIEQGFNSYHFADPIRRLCSDVFLWSSERMDKDNKEIVDPRFGISPRKAMQLIGTELFRLRLPELHQGFRETTGSDLWVKRFIYWQQQQRAKAVVIPDVRFLNESETIRDLGGYIIKIERPDIASEDNHISEIELNSIIPDTTIMNDGTIEDLKNNAILAYRQIKDKETEARR